MIKEWVLTINNEGDNCMVHCKSWRVSKEEAFQKLSTLAKKVFPKGTFKDVARAHVLNDHGRINVCNEYFSLWYDEENVHKVGA